MFAAGDGNGVVHVFDLQQSVMGPVATLSEANNGSGRAAGRRSRGGGANGMCVCVAVWLCVCVCGCVWLCVSVRMTCEVFPHPRRCRSVCPVFQPAVAKLDRCR